LGRAACTEGLSLIPPPLFRLFDIPALTTNLRTRLFPDSSQYTVYIIGTNPDDGFSVTNDFTISVSGADYPVFVAEAEVAGGPADGTLVGTARVRSAGPGLGYKILGGREDMFTLSGAELLVTNKTLWAGIGIGSTNYVTLQAADDVGTNTLIVAVTTVSGTPDSTIFLFR